MPYSAAAVIDGQIKKHPTSGTRVPTLPFVLSSGNINKTTRKKHRKAKKRSNVINQTPGGSGGSPSIHLGQGGAVGVRSYSSEKTRRNRGGGVSSFGGPPPLHLPHAKVVMRNVCDTGRNGTDHEMVRLVRELMASFNASIALRNDGIDTHNTDGVGEADISLLPLVLEKSSVKRAMVMQQIYEETNVDDEKCEKVNNNALDKSVEESNDDGQFDGGKERQKNTEKSEDKKNYKKVLPESVNNKRNEVVSGFEDAVTPLNALSVRILYVVPPRKSHHRGEITGRAYMVLHPPMTVTINSNTYSGVANKCVRISKTNESTANDISTRSKDRISRTMTAVDRSRAIAKAHILLRRTVSRLSELCKADAASAQRLARAQVEISPNQKTWKADVPVMTACGSKKGHGYGFNFAKYDSTLKQSEDFQKFIKEKAREQEELLNRPKPTPGGIRTAIDLRRDENAVLASGAECKVEVTSSSQNTPVTEDGRPLAAIVLHLREKHLQKKKKSNAGSKKSIVGGTSVASSSVVVDLQMKIKHGCVGGFGVSEAGGSKSTQSGMTAKKSSSVFGKKSSGGGTKKSDDEIKEWKKSGTSKVDASKSEKKIGFKTSKKGFGGGGVKIASQHNKHQGKGKKPDNKNTTISIMSQTPKILKKNCVSSHARF